MEVVTIPVRKVHLRFFRNISWCGFIVSEDDPEFDRILVDDPSLVTCKKCLKTIKKEGML